MQLYALETNCKIWNDGVNLYGFIYCIFPYSWRNIPQKLPQKYLLQLQLVLKKIFIKDA